MVRAKFTVTEKKEDFNGVSVTLRPVTGGSPENESFYKATPCGQMEIMTINPNAASAFEVGKSYYVDFTKAEA